MMDEKIKQRVFIVGCPRSGTTLLQGMLAAHPRIKSFPETHFFPTAYPRNRLKRLITWPALNLQGLLERFVQDLGRSDLIEDAHIGLLDRNFYDSFTSVLDRLTLDAGKDIWVEKTPGHIRHIKEILNRIPKAKFVHNVRNGADVVASLCQVTRENPVAWRKKRMSGFHGLSIDQCIERWNSAMLITAKWHRGPGHFLVKYEALVESPSNTLKDICSFLQIDYDPQMEREGKAFHEIVTSDEVWKTNALKRVRKVKSKFDAVFSEEERDQVLKNLIKIDL